MRKLDLCLFHPLRRQPRVYFYALACGMNIAILLVHRMVVPLPRLPMAVAQAAAPTISAMRVAAALNGKQGVHEVLAHFFFNGSSGFLVQFLGWMPPLWLHVGGGSWMALLTLWVVLFFGPRNLSRRLKPAGVSVRMQIDRLVQ